MKPLINAVMQKRRLKRRFCYEISWKLRWNVPYFGQSTSYDTKEHDIFNLDPKTWRPINAHWLTSMQFYSLPVSWCSSACFIACKCVRSNSVSWYAPVVVPPFDTHWKQFTETEPCAATTLWSLSPRIEVSFKINTFFLSVGDLKLNHCSYVTLDMWTCSCPLTRQTDHTMTQNIIVDDWFFSWLIHSEPLDSSVCNLFIISRAIQQLSIFTLKIDNTPCRLLHRSSH